MRFRAQDEPTAVARVRWESEDGAFGIWDVEGRDAHGAPVPALARAVDDSSAGTSILVVGGARGLKLTLDSGEVAFEPYLLVSRDAVST